ncbi:MAG TPA: enoyl-CoA hydratase-related protein [Dehalococcoidia bacterium]
MYQYQEILYQVEDPVAVITLNRPERLNAATDRMLRELRHALAAAERDGRVVGVVLTGAGRGFCAGVDMTELRKIEAAGDIAAMQSADDVPAASPGDPAMGEDFRSGLAYLLAVRKPVLAAVNGPCAGYGLSLALFCDLRFAAEGAVFTTNFSPAGLVAEYGQSWLLPRLVGPARALDLLWSARRVGAEEARALGLVDRVVPGERLLAEAAGYVRDLAARCSPAALADMKRQVYRHLMVPLGPALAETERLTELSFRRPDFAEGFAAYAERRPPRFPRLVTD